MPQKVSSLYFILALYQGTGTYGCTKKCSTAGASLTEPISQVPRFPGEAAAQNYMPALPTKYVKEVACLRIAKGWGGGDKKSSMSSSIDLPIARGKMYHQSQLSPGLCHIEINNFRGKFRVPRLHWPPHKTQAWNRKARPIVSFAHPSNGQHSRVVWAVHHFDTVFLAFSLEGVITSTQYSLGGASGFPGTASHHTLLKLFGVCIGLQDRKRVPVAFGSFLQHWILIWGRTRTQASCFPRWMSRLPNRIVTPPIPCVVRQLQIKAEQKEVLLWKAGPKGSTRRLVFTEQTSISFISAMTCV